MHLQMLSFLCSLMLISAVTPAIPDPLQGGGYVSLGRILGSHWPGLPNAKRPQAVPPPNQKPSAWPRSFSKRPFQCWDLLLGRPVKLTIYEDNQATIKVLNKGYSSKLRHVTRHHKVDLGSVKEVLDEHNVELQYIETTKQCADIFTKALTPCKWPHAVGLLGIKTGTSEIATPAECVLDCFHGSNVEGQSACDAPPPKGILAACAISDEAIANMPYCFSEAQVRGYHKLCCKNVHNIMAAPATDRPRPSGKRPGWGVVYEICTRSNSNLGNVSLEFDNVSVIRVSPEIDFSNAETVEQIKAQIAVCPGASVHGFLPCTPWCNWQSMSIHNFGAAYVEKLKFKRKASFALLQSFVDVAEFALSLGGEVSFAWPRYCSGWT